VFRIGLGLQVTLYVLFLRSDWHYLFTSSGKGLVGRELGEAITSFESPLIPRFGWLIAVGRNLNMSEQTVLTVAWVALLSAGCLLLLWLFSRQQRLSRGLSSYVLSKAEGLLAYGADNFMTTALFYQMLCPLAGRYSFDHWVAKPRPNNPQAFGVWAASVKGASVLCYFIGSLAKSLGNGWWDGSNLWRSLIRLPFT
jgi:hypothetical protein